MRTKQSEPTPETLAERLRYTRSRGEVKRLGDEADQQPIVRDGLLVLARRRQLELPTDTDGRQLVRLLLARSDAAQIRTNPIRLDAGFQCACCGADVPLGGTRVRDHCPICLRGQHVDVVPGDRASTCGALLDPIGFELRGRDGVVIRYRCRGCGGSWRGRAHADDRIPASLPDRIDDPLVWRPESEGRLLSGG